MADVQSEACTLPAKLLNGLCTFPEAWTFMESPAEALVELALRSCLLLKTKTPSRAMLRPRRRLDLSSPTILPEVGLVLFLPRSITAVPEQTCTVPRGFQGRNDGGHGLV